MRTVDAAGLAIGDDHPPRIMGVLNVSQESPYDPSVFDDPGEASEYVDERLIDEGADIVDIGLESANKRFEVLSPEEELDRLDTAIETIESTSGDAVFSIETRYHEVAEEALNRGFDMVNDICGFADPELPRVCREYDVAVCKMASPPDLERPGAIEDVDEIYEALGRNGLTEKTIVDPAFGGWSEDKRLEDDRETFRRLREFRAIGHPILVSINRKNFLRNIADRSTEEALPVSLAATSMAVERGARLIRTHDVAETRDAALVGYEFERERTRRHPDDDIAIDELDVTTPREAKRHAARLESETEADDYNATRSESTAWASQVVSRCFRLDGLPEPARRDFRERARENGVAVFEGVDGDSDAAVLVGGSHSALRSLADSLLETDCNVPTELAVTLADSLERW